MSWVSRVSDVRSVTVSALLQVYCNYFAVILLTAVRARRLARFSVKTYVCMRLLVFSLGYCSVSGGGYGPQMSFLIRSNTAESAEAYSRNTGSQPQIFI